MGALGFKIWIFAPKSYLFGGIRVRNQLISAVCLQFALKSLFFNDFFAIIPLFKPLNVSCLFTFSSADCLLFVSCLFGGIRVQNQLISAVYLQLALKSLFFNDFFATIPSLKLQMSADCLQFQLFVYFLSAVLFTFSAICLQFQLFVYFFVSWLFTFEFSRQNPCFFMTFLPLQMLQHFNCKLLLKQFYLSRFSNFLEFWTFFPTLKLSFVKI